MYFLSRLLLVIIVVLFTFLLFLFFYFFFFQAEDGIRDTSVTGVQTCALPISLDRSAQRIVASNYSRSSLPICVERFSCATFGKRKNLSLQNLVSPCSAAI